MVTSMLTIRDVLTGSIQAGGKKIELEAVLPFVIIPLLMLVSTLSRIVTLVVLTFTVMAVLYVQSRPRKKNRSPFFLSWTLSSGIYLFLIYEFEVLTWLEVTQIENFIFLSLLAFTCYFFYKMKAVADFELATGTSKGKVYSPILTADSKYCQICQIEVNDMFFHSIWWDCCILRPNYPYYVGGLIFAFATLLCGTNYALTSICQPIIVYGQILMPEDCSDVYDDFSMAISFVACVYSGGYLVAIILMMLYQVFFYIPKYMGYQLVTILDHLCPGDLWTCPAHFHFWVIMVFAMSFTLGIFLTSSYLTLSLSLRTRRLFWPTLTYLGSIMAPQWQKLTNVFSV